MKKRSIRPQLFLVLALAATCAPGTSVGQDHNPLDHAKGPSRGVDALGAGADELECYQLYKQEKFLTARTKAEEILDGNPDSILANFVLGEVLRQAEGDLPRAMYRLGRARKLFEDKYGSPPERTAPTDLHREMLYDTYELASGMEEWDYALQVLDYSDSMYDPPMVAEHAWPLLKLGKNDEARKAADDAIKSKDPGEQSFGRNVLCALEGELHTRKPYYTACVAAYEGAKAEAAAALAAAGKDGTPAPTSVPVHAYNAALASFSVLKYDEVERFAHEAGKSAPDTVANPWRLLGRYYLDSARFAEAVPAMRAMQDWRAHEPASLRDQDHAETDVALATMLLVVGESDAAQKLVDRAVARPDRRGFTSSKAEQAIGAHALLRRAIARTQAEREAERRSFSGFGQKLKSFWNEEKIRVSAWPDDERIAGILTDTERLEATFRVYLVGGLEPLPTWLTGDLVDVLGAGVAQVVLERARKADADMAELTPYYDAMEAEIDLAQGDYAAAVQLADKATKGLPKSEAMLTARTFAVGAEAARKKGDLATELRYFESAMQKDAGVVRRLGLAIPALVKTEGSDPVMTRAAELISNSPRLTKQDHAFVVSLAKQGPVIRICLLSSEGSQLSCTAVQEPPKEPPKPEKPADPRQVQDQAPPPPPPPPWEEQLADAFHRDVFAPTVGLSTMDLNSLNGSTTVASQAQREQMTGVLKDMADQDSP